MAISYVQPLLLLLLASLFFLPAFGELIDFRYCNKKGYKFGNLTRVEVSPTDTQYILIYGSTSNTSKTLVDGALDLSLVIDQFRFRIMRETDLRGVLWGDLWPLQPGKDFVLRVYREKYLRFYDKYMSILTLFSDYEGSGKLKEQMCIKFKLPRPVSTQ